jgi:hypothetical protein
MDGKLRRNLEILMGIIIIVADLYWTYTSYPDQVWVSLGVIILLAAVFWVYLDLSQGES